MKTVDLSEWPPLKLMHNKWVGWTCLNLVFDEGKGQFRGKTKLICIEFFICFCLRKRFRNINIRKLQGSINIDIVFDINCIHAKLRKCYARAVYVRTINCKKVIYRYWSKCRHKSSNDFDCRRESMLALVKIQSTLYVYMFIRVV